MQFEYLIPICVLKSPYWILFGLFDSPCVGIGPHMKEGVKHDIHIKRKSYKFEILGEWVV